MEEVQECLTGVFFLGVEGTVCGGALGVVFEVGGDHDKQAVGPDAASEVRVVASGIQNVLEEND